MSKFARMALAGLMAAGILGGTTQAFASGGGGGITTEGSCSGASTWKLTLSTENNQVEAQLEVDQNVIGDTRRVIMKDNGVVFFRGKAVTQGPSGSFEIRKLTADQNGTDNVVGLARNVSTGETCMATGSI
jgi:hypothetical protein